MCLCTPVVNLVGKNINVNSLPSQHLTFKFFVFAIDIKTKAIIFCKLVDLGWLLLQTDDFIATIDK